MQNLLALLILMTASGGGVLEAAGRRDDLPQAGWADTRDLGRTPIDQTMTYIGEHALPALAGGLVGGVIGFAIGRKGRGKRG